MEYKSRDLFGDFQQLLTLIERVEIISVPMFLLIPHEPWNGKKDALSLIHILTADRQVTPKLWEVKKVYQYITLEPNAENSIGVRNRYACLLYTSCL